MSKSFIIGYIAGSSGQGTNGYKPKTRKGESLAQYTEGFQAGMAKSHELKAPQRQELARLACAKKDR